MLSFTQSSDKMVFEGLSSDDKPVGNYKDYKVTNGSIFIEIDTAQIFKYDEENEQWCAW